MASPVDYFAGISWLANLVLDIGAAYYGYKLTKITGGFRAWWLIIIFTVIFALSSFSSVSYSVLISTTRGQTTNDSGLLGSAFFSLVLNLLLSILLFSAMFDLYRTFKKHNQSSAQQ